MAMPNKLVVLLAMALVAATSSSCCAWELNIRMPTARSVEEAVEEAAAPLIHALRPLVSSGGDLGRRGGVPCDSWRLAVEAYNMRDWKTVPAHCEDYIGNYMLGKHYRRDSRVVVDEAIAYAEGLKLAGNGKEVWVFDIDETSLSNLPYFAEHGFGTKSYNAMTFNEYVFEGSAPALPPGDEAALRESRLAGHQAGVPDGPEGDPEGHHCRQPPQRGLLRLAAAAAQARRAQRLHHRLQVRRAEEAGGRRLRHRR